MTVITSHTSFTPSAIARTIQVLSTTRNILFEKGDSLSSITFIKFREETVRICSFFFAFFEHITAVEKADMIHIDSLARNLVAVVFERFRTLKVAIEILS
jgi:hypothetical protein